MFILRYILFLQKGILAACNRNVNQRDNLPVRPWPALPMLTQGEKKVQNANCSNCTPFTGCFARLTFYTAVHAWDN